MNIELSDIGNTPFEKLLGHNPEVLNNWINLESRLFKNNSLNPLLLEQVRRALAYENECEYCLLKAGKPSFKEEKRHIVEAVAFAQQYAINHKTIDQNHFNRLRQHFNTQQISELCAFNGFMTSCQQFGKIMNLN